MITTDNKTQKIIQVYKLLRSQLKKYGRFISFPKNTKPNKTYIWRYLSKFVDKYDEIGINEDEMPGIIEAVVINAKKKGILRCGAAILNKVDLLAICHEKLERENSEENKTIHNIKDSHEFLLDKCNGEITAEKLLYKPSKRSYTNIIRWYQSNELTAGYIVMSKICRSVINQLDKHEQELLPNTRNSISIRMRLQCREQVMNALRNVLGTDLLEA